MQSEVSGLLDPALGSLGLHGVQDCLGLRLLGTPDAAGCCRRTENGVGSPPAPRRLNLVQGQREEEGRRVLGLLGVGVGVGSLCLVEAGSAERPPTGD